MASFKFIAPSEPIEASLPPEGEDRIVEVKWDGYRAQLHKQGHQVHIFSRNGRWMTRFRALLPILEAIPARSAIIDAELVALNAKGKPDFRALHGGQRHSLAFFCFDLMELNGKDLRPLPLVQRRKKLQALLTKASIPELQFSQTHEDANALLARLDKEGFEGIVSKTKNQRYISGRNSAWVKVKCHAWRKAHADRPDFFRKHKT